MHLSSWYTDIAVKKFVSLAREDQLEIKLTNTREVLKSVCHKQVISARLLASLIGKIILMSLALVRLKTRSMYAILNRRVSWC